MAEKDIAEKLLFDYEDVFSDIINVLIFGKDMIKSEEIVPTKTASQYKADDAKLHSQERDVAKYWKKGECIFALFGLENQTQPDKFMPLRFTSDFRYVAILLRRLRTGRPYPMSDAKYKHAREIIDLFRVMSQNNKEIGIILDDIKNERNHTGGAHMTVEEMDEMINRFENRGAQKQAVEAAKNLYTNGVSIDVISKSLNMTPEQVKEIVKDVVVLQA